MRFFIKCRLLLIIAILQGCSATIAKKHNNNCITGISVTQGFPIIATTGKIIYIDTSTTKIYYYQNKILYIINYSYYPKVYDLNNPDTAYFGDPHNFVKGYSYFVYTKGDKYGYITDSYNKLNKAKILADSFIQNQWFSSIDVYTNITEDKGTIKVFYEIKNSDSGILRKYFLFNAKDEGKTSGTVYWEFSDKLKKFPYSFSPQLDSIYNSKLSKVRIVNFPKYFKDYNFMLDTMKQNFDLEEINNIDTSEVMKYFNVEKK